jgi:hypothetical protein
MINGPLVENQYECGIVLCGGLYQKDRRWLRRRYAPTTYHHSDDFGMLGGDMRRKAAAELYLRGIVGKFYTVGGVSAKQREKFGRFVPPEGKIYAEAIRSLVAERRREEPEKFGPAKCKKEDIVEVVGEAYNTASELVAAMQAIGNKAVNVGVVSNQYHTGLRVPHLVRLLKEKGHIPEKPIISYLAAEDVVWELEPDRYIDEIVDGYTGPEARKRGVHELNGLGQLVYGELVGEPYHLGEFQKFKPAESKLLV